MRDRKVINVALVGNPNTGKSSLFNQLTGLSQKVSNYPGVTVEKKYGLCKLTDAATANIIDLPGTYSINPNTIDESIVLDTLINNNNTDYPDVIIVVADIVNIKRNLLLFSQIKDLEIPTILAINMSDQMERKGITIAIDLLQEELKSKTILISARKNIGIEALKKLILIQGFNKKVKKTSTLSNFSNRMDAPFFTNIKNEFKDLSLYKAWLYITQLNDTSFLTKEEQLSIVKFREDENKLARLQHKETVLRYQLINNILKKTYKIDQSKATSLRAKLDRILTHKIFGYVIFAMILMLIFQAVFDLAQYPMEFIDESFAKLSSFTKDNLPTGVLTNLISEGIIPGIGGIIIFIPQIVILFLLVAILEETGYMSRVVFLMDKIMRRYGMSGKSVVPLISGTACAIPAIMATRNISGFKERLITILVTPLTTCAARIPVYAIIIALVIPNNRFFGFSLQGLTLMILYLIGFIAAIIAAYILNKILKVNNKSYFIIEMPDYTVPSFKNIFYTILEKTKAFIFGAGKIILAISIVLWFLATNGPSSFKNADKTVQNMIVYQNLSDIKLAQKIATYKLEHSYIGIMGKTIEPAIKPLGYDWKIGIALISSFAAREVFVGTLATIYSVESTDDDTSLKEKMRAEKHPITGKKRFDLPTGMSLLIFYAFAMQCMGTLAIVKRETNSWRWPLYQLIGMTSLAYVAALFTYLLLK
ncbi:MAG: ferrous iron transport protein B [Flavobacteriaceae bacterium]|nr:ferrous iron transport protein B [Flavobacteriaceae bacterium]